jgi:hypothetical protein
VASRPAGSSYDRGTAPNYRDVPATSAPPPSGTSGYNPPAGSYTPGNTGYNPPASDYRPGDNGYNPPGASPYRSPAGSTMPGASPAADDDPHYRPAGTSDYVPRSSAGSMARAPSDTNGSVSPTGYSSGPASYLR